MMSSWTGLCMADPLIGITLGLQQSLAGASVTPCLLQPVAARAVAGQATRMSGRRTALREGPPGPILGEGESAGQRIPRPRPQPCPGFSDVLRASPGTLTLGQVCTPVNIEK